ncbi:MAG: hypothetical protein ACREV6_05855 [Clostridium sp.]|uniref:hypothetical protein n=1 Tax=Clostridium sp. TaxID=1506 RepID=UPI003D6CB4E6
MKKLEDYTPNELATLSTIIGIIIASKYNINQQNVVGNFLDGVGQTLFIIAAQAQNLQQQSGNSDTKNGNNNSNSSNVHLQKQIDELKEHIKKFQNNMK